MRETKADIEKAAVKAQQAMARTHRLAFLDGRHKEILRRRSAGESLRKICTDLEITRERAGELEVEALKIANEDSDSA